MARQLSPAQQVKQVRQRLGLTQQQFGDRIGVSVVTVNRWENAEVNPTREAWREILTLAMEAGPPSFAPQKAGSSEVKEGAASPKWVAPRKRRIDARLGNWTDDTRIIALSDKARRGSCVWHALEPIAERALPIAEWRRQIVRDLVASPIYDGQLPGHPTRVDDPGDQSVMKLLGYLKSIGKIGEEEDRHE